MAKKEAYEVAIQLCEQRIKDKEDMVKKLLEQIETAKVELFILKKEYDNA